MPVLFKDANLIIDGESIEMQWPILATLDAGEWVFVLLNPDSYLAAPGYKESRHRGAPAIRNLIALNRQGNKIWEAEFPEPADYYSISGGSPLIAKSFSSFRCEISSESGAIVKKEFFK